MTKKDEDICEKMSAGELSELSDDIATLSSFMDGGCARHGGFEKAKKAFEKLRAKKHAPGNFETFAAVCEALERRWGPPKLRHGFEDGPPSAAPSFIDGATILFSCVFCP